MTFPWNGCAAWIRRQSLRSRFVCLLRKLVRSCSWWGRYLGILLQNIWFLRGLLGFSWIIRQNVEDLEDWQWLLWFMIGQYHSYWSCIFQSILVAVSPSYDSSRTFMTVDHSRTCFNPQINMKTLLTTASKHFPCTPLAHRILLYYARGPTQLLLMCLSNPQNAKRTNSALQKKTDPLG